MPTVSTIAKRLKFHNRKQEAGGSVKLHVAALKNM